MRQSPALEATEIGLAEAHGDMRRLLVIVAADHFAVLIEPGKRRTIAHGNFEMDELAVAVDP